MSVDTKTVARIAHLARLAVKPEELEPLAGEINAILTFVEQLSAVDTDGVEPMTSVVAVRLKQRADQVTDGAIPEKVTANAPSAEDHFFAVPKVVE